MSFVIYSCVYLSEWIDMGAYRFEISNVFFCFSFLQVVCQEESLEMNKNKKNGDTKKKKLMNQ